MSTLDLRFSRVRHDRVSNLVVWLRRVAELLLAWHERARQRRHLEALSDHMLRDIGLSRVDVLAESSKPFWRS